MEYNSKHPCDLCNHSDNCDINCVFYSYYSSYCRITNVFITIVILSVSMARGVVHTSVIHHLSYALTTKKMKKKNSKHNERIEKLWQM